MFEVIILSIVQGITEFLPISSSAHLIIIAKYFNFSNANLTLDVSLHLGSLLAVMFYFKKELLNFFNNKKLFLKIILSSLPVMVVGFFLIKLDLIDYLRNFKILGWTTIIFGILLYYCDQFKVKKKLNKNFTFLTALYIGLFQILSLIPGVSRSGIIISSARFFNFNRIDSAKISFLLSIPTLTAVSLFNIQTLFIEKNLYISTLNLLGVFLSFIFSFITIKFLIKFLKKFSLISFVVYRIFLGLIILFYSYL
jgi:undecaprenyl-diphosphatase|tara:strand:+ start:6638 stop:7396 length:759 start_codon:yes stop_codon:yes gene_type:complete